MSTLSFIILAVIAFAVLCEEDEVEEEQEKEKEEEDYFKDNY